LALAVAPLKASAVADVFVSDVATALVGSCKKAEFVLAINPTPRKMMAFFIYYLNY
jgi:hypothetical protein